MRNNIPIIDEAINKIVMLCEGFKVETGNKNLDKNIKSFLDSVNVGGNQQGINSFLNNYLNQLLTFGTAVGEIVLNGSGIYALYNSDLTNLELKRANDIDVEFYNNNQKIENPNLVLYSVLNPKPNCLVGTSLLSGLEFVSDILLKIFKTIGQNWEHAGNLRYAVICKPSDDNGIDATAQAKAVSEAFSQAMDTKTVKDFVAVGDVKIEVIGSDNKVLDSEIPVKQMLEQIIAKTGIPPYMFGLNWSTTERMSHEQADVLTTQLESYRRILTPIIKKIVSFYLMSIGEGTNFEIIWDDITLQDRLEEAQANYYDRKAN